MSDETAASAPDSGPQRPTRTQFFFGDERDGPPDDLPDPPGWRDTTAQARREQGAKFQVDRRPGGKTVAMVNAALLLRRPLLVTGKPGTGKSTLARAVAERLRIGPLLEWPITTRTTLREGLYQYDAIGRLNAASMLRQELEMRLLERRAGGGDGVGGGSEARGEPASDDDAARRGALDIGRFITLGPLGTALAPRAPGRPDSKRPRVLLIDEIDKGDIDLPNDLLHVFEKGEFEIPELSRLADDPRYQRVTVGAHDGTTVEVAGGWVRCGAFPLVVMTSNGEREFPPAFLRRCLRLKMEPPEADELKAIVQARLNVEADLKDENDPVGKLIKQFLALRDGSPANPETRELAVDQLLNAVYLLTQGADVGPILDDLFQTLTGAP